MGNNGQQWTTIRSSTRISDAVFAYLYFVSNFFLIIFEPHLTFTVTLKGSKNIQEIQKKKKGLVAIIIHATPLGIHTHPHGGDKGQVDSVHFAKLQIYVLHFLGGVSAFQLCDIVLSRCVSNFQVGSTISKSNKHPMPLFK